MRKLIIGGGLLIAVGLALTALVNRWSRTDRITLPGGRILEVVGTTYGTNHIAPGQFLQRLDKQLPKPAAKILRRWWPRAADPVQFDDEEFRSTLIVWFRFVGNSGTNRSQIHLLAELAEPVGNVAGSLVWPQSGPTPATLPQGPRLTLLNFPRNQRALTLRILAANPTTHLFDPIQRLLRIRNPHPYRGPEFHAEPLPLVRTNQGLRAELSELKLIHHRFERPGKPARDRSEIQFSLKAETEAHQPATILNAKVFDACGNGIWDLIPTEHQPGGSPGIMTFGIGRDLGSVESAYRLQVEAVPPGIPQHLETVTFIVDPGDPRDPTSEVCNPRLFRSSLVPGLEIHQVRAEGLTLGTVSCIVGGPAVDAQVSLISTKDSKGNSVRFSSGDHFYGDQGPISSLTRSAGQWRTWAMNPSADPNLTPPYTLTFQIQPIARFEFTAAPRHLTNLVRAPK